MGIEIHCEPKFTEQRRAKRNGVQLNCTVRERSRSAVDATINDFSASGIRIQSNGVPLPGNQIWVRLSGLDSLTGRVAWTNGNLAGVEFERPLHPAVALRFEPRARQDTATYTEGQAPASNVVALDPLLSRREQIMQGVAGSDHSPLKRRKQPTGAGIMGSISRTVARNSDHRNEARYSDITTTGHMALTIGTQSAQVEDVSSSGIRIRAELMIEIGGTLPITFEGFDPIDGKLVWMGNGEAGISLPPASLELHGNHH